ncbi:hypothetical protein, partial [Escherichia coli]|uniref:hypothetical protein n=1 Tax=Escherichia coli TaxID=562 RepID=UPI001C384EDA
SASALAWNVQYFVDTYGLSNVGFLTLTFRDHVTDPKEAQRRLTPSKQISLPKDTALTSVLWSL